jgi:hypothetical protein
MDLGAVEGIYAARGGEHRPPLESDGIVDPHCVDIGPEGQGFGMRDLVRSVRCLDKEQNLARTCKVVGQRGFDRKTHGLS